MPSLTFYWKGSTAASINSLSWDTVTNWRIQSYSATAGTSLQAAPRLPLGGDVVNFGAPYSSSNFLNSSIMSTLSPCLFGGVTTASTSWWSGATAGSSLLEKHGGIGVNVYPSYPFSKLGGKIDEQILEEWTRNLQVQYWLGNATPATGPNQWTLASGTEYTDAQYVSQWYGQTVGISYANQPTYSIRHRGYWGDGSKYGTLTSIVGITGNTGGAGGTGFAYDGSGNRVSIFNFGGIPQNGTGGNISDTFVGWAGFSHGVQTPIGEVYRHGSIEVSGHYNTVSSDQRCTRDAKIILTNAKVNSVVLAPQFAEVFGVTGFGEFKPVGVTTSWFELGGLFMDKDSTSRYILVKNLDKINGEITIFGDITASGGFVCAAPSGASAGASGGVLVPNGTMHFYPPITEGAASAVVGLGYPQSEGTKQTTAITHFYAEEGIVPVEYTLKGNYTGTNFWLKNGTVTFNTDLPPRATIEISNLSLQGNSVLDATPASPGFQGTANITIVPTTNTAVVKPGAGNQLSMATLFSLNG